MPDAKTPITWADIKHFSPLEFDSPDSVGSGGNMKIAFVYRLEKLRELCGFPLKVHSGYRTHSHNAAVGGKSESEHMDGWGCDLEAMTSGRRFKIVQFAFALGFPRIGIGKTFVHLGMSPLLPQEVMWDYYD